MQCSSSSSHRKSRDHASSEHWAVVASDEESGCDPSVDSAANLKAYPSAYPWDTAYPSSARHLPLAYSASTALASASSASSASAASAAAEQGSSSRKETWLEQEV